MSTVILPVSTSRATVRSSAPDARTTASAARTRLRLTRRGRVVLTLLVAIPLVIVVALAVLNGGRASAGNTQSSVTFQTVTIQPGESLWQLAEQKAPNSDPRDFIQDVVSLNDLQSSAVQAGEQIAIPTKYTQR